MNIIDIIEKENFTKYLNSNREELKEFDYKLIKIQGENYSEVFENAVKIINS